MFCTKCGTENPEGASVCTSCGAPLGQNAQAPQGQPAPQGQGVQINVNPQEVSDTVTKNIIGTVGLVFAILTVFLSFVPVLGSILWIVAIVCSAIGLSKEPKGLAVSGLAVSLFVLIMSSAPGCAVVNTIAGSLGNILR